MSRWSTRLREEAKRLAAYARALKHRPNQEAEQLSLPFLFRATIAQLGRTRRLHAACERLGVGGSASAYAARSIGRAESVCRQVWASERLQREWEAQLGALVRTLDLEEVGTDPWATWTCLSGLEDAADEMDEFFRMGAEPQGVLSSVLLSNTEVHPFTARLRRLPAKAMGELTVGLQNYRLANLTIRALADRTEGSTNVWVKVHDMTHTMDDSAIINAVLRVLGGDREDERDLRNFVNSVLKTIGDLGLDGLREVTSADTRTAGSAAVGGQQVNVIPASGGKSVCAPFVLAIISGVKGRWGFPSVLRELTEHLISCFGTSKQVLVVTDIWDGAGFRRDHLGNWRALHGHGVKFAVLHYTGTSNQPTVLPVDLS